MSKKNAPRTISQGLFPANRATIKKHLIKYGGAGQGRGATYDNYGYQAELASRLHRDWPNGQKQIYVSQSSLYDSMSNMPGENSSRTRERCKRCLLFFGIILLVSAIVVSIVLAIYFSQRDIQVTPKPTVVPTTQTMVSTTQTTITVPKPVVKKYDVALTTVGNFTPALKDSSSTEYKKKEESVKKTMDAIYMNSSLADRYNGTEVLGFRKSSQGSIIVKLRVYFIIIITPASPTPAARNMTDPPPPVGNTTQTIKTTTTQQPDIVIDIIIRQVTKKVIEENAERLQLDPTKNISIIEITTTVRPPTTPIRTTKTPILTTKTTAPPPPPTSLAPTEITKTTRPLTEQPTIPYTEPSNCNPGLISCKSGQCIRRDWFCDKYIDCLDASDEDDNRCHRNTTQPPVVNPKSTGNDLNCNFDNHTKQLCNYKTSPGVYNWSVAQGPTNSNNTGPDFDHTFMNSKGRFLFTESSYGNYNDNATVTSIIVTTDNISHSLTFYYHMYGAHMGSLEVYFNIFKPKGLQRDLKWRESGNHGNMWLKGCILMPKETKLSVEFVAYRGLNYTSDIAIDDIKYSTDSCTSISCSYEHSNCGHLINLITPGSYKWQRVRGEEMMSKQEAPKTDFTLGKKYGAFLVADSINGKVNDRAIFHTPLIRTLKETTLNIRLYISGSNVGHLRLNLLSHPDLLSNSTTQISSLTQGWKRICEPIPKGFVGFAEFVAVRGDGTSGFIAVDDVSLGPETTCDGFSTCKFKSGIFCNFDVIGKDYRWKHFSSLKGGYLIANGEGTEGANSKLVSPKFIPLPNSSISFRYAIEGTSILSVWATEYTKTGDDKKKIWTTEGLMTGVQTTSTANIFTQANSLSENNSSNMMDWLTACINLPMANNISIEIVSRKIDQNGGKVALDWVNINKKPCEIGLTYSACNFDEPNLCNYEIECPISTQYRWKRNSGSTPTIGTGPPRDHTFNNTIGHYLFTESTVGRPEDKAVVTFIDVQSTMNTSIRFNYYMSGSDIGALYIIVGGKSDKINWIQEGNKAPFWYFGCVDLASNKKVNVSFYGIHGNGPLGDIAIDDVRLSQEKCPERHIVCDFENEMMCGYTGLSTRRTRDEKSFEEQWLRVNGSSIIMPQLDHTFHSSKGHFLVTIHPSKIASPRIPYGLTMCLKFYYYIQMGKGQNIKVIADYVDNKKNIEKLFGTNGFSLARWRQGQMTLIPGNVSIIFSVEHYNQEISSTVFAIDDVNINYGKCNATVCDKEMFKCDQDDICIPNYKKCDMVRDCSDGADELNCPTNSSKIRLVDGITSGDQGRLEIYVNGSWGTAYSLRWFESNAKVACRQLGYTGYYKSVRFGKFFFGLGDVWQINCIGNETSLQDCDKVNVVHSISHMYDVGLACYNTICEPGKRVCPKVANSSVVYCLYPSQFCDGDYDCPGGEDEKNCSHCKANEFACKNHKCILKTERCDGKPDCADASDEMHCIRRDVESHVELFYNDSWMPLCDSGSNEAFNSKLCLIMGHGVSKRKTVSSSTAIGLNPTPDSSKMTVIGKYLLSPSSKPCRKMKLECYGQECGSRAQRMFDPYVQFGNQAVPTEYPWQAMLLRNGNFHCGASIFNSRWLITAEHCVVERYVKYEVVVGLLRMQDLNKFPKIKVIEIIHSMNYGSYKGIPINDISLILLEKDIVFTDYIQPVCLPSKVFTANDYCYLSGWGRDENLVSQSHLKETKVYAISSEECKKYYDNITDNSFICFRHNKPNMPSCYGDSGGPLVCRNDRGRFELAGVVSFGLPLCAASNGTPAAFTNVLNFRGWIVDQTRCKMWCPDGKCLYEAETCDGIDHCRDRSDELPPKCTPTVTCNFGKAYKCGYRNDSNNPWYWASPHWSTPYMKSKPMTGGDRETDEYMLASVNATESSPAILISPTAKEIPCISFNYLANANNTAKTVLILKVAKQGSSSYKEIWNHGKNNTHEKMFFWQLATISLPTKTTSLKFEAYYENPDQYSFIAIDNINLMDKHCTVCLSTEFQCNTGQCINRKNVCDRIQHCSDGSDELNCFQSNSPAVCSSDHFQCLNGKCILKDRKCNGIIDCTDGSDEKNCTKDSGHCSWDQFRCTDGQCIEDYLRCDGFWHCSDGSDELNCHQTTVVPSGICKWNQFRCNNGQCIEFHLKCDNIKHCKDGSDEKNCGEKTTVQPGGCTWDQFRCDNGQCIQAFLRCDRLWHCKDGSDERNCPVSTQIPAHCRWDQFQCNNGNCIESYLKCDGVNHCKDGSDEQFCYRTTTEIAGRCLPSQFRCNNGQCIESFLKCDKVKHCKDGSDEQNCGAATIQPQGNCRWDQFHCKNGQCIQYYHRCDHIWHCKDGSDEQNCLKPMIKKTDCNFNEFGCLDGKCIKMILVCNKNKDCSLGEDEHNCTNTTHSISATSKTTTCAANEFRCDERQCIPTAFVCDVIPDCDNAKDELSCDDDVTTTVKNTQPLACFPNEFKCDENQCIPNLFVCDIIPDCDNGRDEENCEKPTTTAENLLPESCQDYQFRCSNGECILKSKHCDQMVDCADHSDEQNCGNTIKPITEACAGNEFRCDERQCIPTAFVCDAIPDCDNGKDEKNCENVTTNVKNTQPNACQDHQFRCSNGECILKSKRCDRMVDCADHSDEHNCVNTITPSQSTTIKPTIKGCTDNQFQCDNGACISISRYCDTFRDCTDGSDEKCSTSTPKSTLKGCSYDDFRCNNGQCIPLSFHCDGLFDCNDRSDENNCSQSPPTQPSIQGCGVDEFHCRNGHCIQLAFVCDGLLDCPDSSDEQNCPLTTPTQATTTTDKCFPLEVKECLQVGYSHSLLPNVFGDKSYTEAMERFYMKAMPIIHQKCSKNALMLFCGTIFPLCKNGVSKYTCKSICKEVEQSCGKDSILMDTCDWLVDDSRWCFIGLTGNDKFQDNKTTSRTTLHPSNEGCRKGYYQCKNSKICLHPIQLCDGEPTCPQADDEPENCTCLPNQFKCASGQCVMKSRRCNGYQDCKDYSDEHNCSENECVGRLCRSGQCVPSSSFCDGIFDCDDLSDEKLCACRPPHRRCNNQVCITPDKWCNREDNCGDNSDEKNCDCSIGEVMCSDGKCIPMEWWCDGNQDCSDGKDESHCHKKKNSTTTSTSTSTSTSTTTTTTTTVPTTTTIVFPFKDNCRLDEFICTRGYKCIKRSKVCDMKWDCVDGEDEATCVSLRKEDSVRNTTAILTLTVKGQTSMVCSSKWSMQWASFICKYLRHKNVKKVEFVDPPPGTNSFQQLLRHSLESPGQDFIRTTSTCATNKIVRMTCNERICGTNRHHSIKYQEFIIGGDLARRYTWPWSVSLLYLGEPMCGATLISDRWLVTAAHCIVTGMWNRTKVPHYFSAILGEVDLFKGLMNGTRIAIDKIVFPRDMKLVVFNPDPDIALLRLKYSVEPSHQIEPICMPKLPKHDQGSTCYLAGWGGTHKPGESRRRYSNFLHEVRMIIRNTSDCSTFQPQPNWDHNLCAGYLESTITGCYGDSGGALMCWEPDNHWTLVGVLSKGRYNCAANSPNVFTKISSMRQWIEKSMGWTSEDAV